MTPTRKTRTRKTRKTPITHTHKTTTHKTPTRKTRNTTTRKTRNTTTRKTHKTPTRKTPTPTKPQPITLSLVTNYLENPKIRHLLLHGAKNSNKHFINKENASKWIQAQTSPNRRLAAESIINTAIYISYNHFIETTKAVLAKFIKLIKNNRFVILSERTQKSGFFCTLLFCHLLQSNHPDTFQNLLAINISFSTLYNKYGNTVHYLMINDMDYSGNQSINSLNTLIKAFTQRETTTPLQLINIRCFQSTTAVKRFKRLNNSKIDITNIVGQVIPTLLESLKKTYPNDYIQRYKEISRYWCLCPWQPRASRTPSKTSKTPKGTTTNTTTVWNTMQNLFSKKETTKKTYPFNYGADCAESNVYFDHKIADPTSTLIVPLISGYVPTDSDYIVPHSWCGKNHLHSDCDEALGPCIKPTPLGNKVPPKRFYALINKCKYGEHIQSFFKQHNYNIFDITNEFMADVTEVRCPDSWYKKINWDIGKITSKSKREILS